MEIINSRPRRIFAEARDDKADQVTLTLDDITFVNMLVELLVQRQPDGSGQSFSIAELLEVIKHDEPAIEPKRFLGSITEYLQRLVSIGVLVEIPLQGLRAPTDLVSRRYGPGRWLHMKDWTYGSASRALGIPYIAHTFGDVVVRVHCRTTVGEVIGSGVVFATNLLMTNAHVLESGGEVFVSFAERQAVRAIVIHKCLDLDLAIVEAPGLVCVPLVFMRDPNPAEPVVALGYPVVPQVPGRPLLRFPGSVASDGYIDTIFGERHSIVCSVFTPGSSGGGVFGVDGQLVGIVVQSLFGELEDPGGRREYPIFHAMIPGGRVRDELVRLGLRDE